MPTLKDYIDYANKKQSGVDEYIRYAKGQNAQSAYDEISRDFDKLTATYSDLYKAYDERQKNGYDTYKADSKSWLQRTANASYDYKSTAGNITRLLDEYGDFFGSEWSNNMRNAVASYNESIDKINENARLQNEFWSKFPDEASYLDYKDKTTADIGKLTNEIHDLEDIYERARLGSTRKEVRPGSTGHKNRASGVYVTPTSWQDLLKENGYTGDHAGLKQLQNDIAQKRAYLDSASMYQGRGEAGALAAMVEQAKNAPDFEKYSAEGATIENPSVYEARGDIFHKPQPLANPVEFVRSQEYIQAAASVVASGGRLKIDGADAFYSNLTDEEVSAYDYYIAAEKAGLVEAGTADKFLNEAQDVLRHRSAERYIEGLPDNIIGDILVGAESGLLQFASGIEGLGRMISERDEDFSDVPINVGDYMLGDWRQRLEDKPGRKILTDVVTTTVNQVPALMVSGVVSAVTNPKIGETVGAVMMGAGAAGNAYESFVREGYTTKQAREYATIIGACEAGLQYAMGGISAFGGGGVKISTRILNQICSGLNNAAAKATIQFVGKFGFEIGSEALEEWTQDVIQPFIVSLVTGDPPDNVDWEEAAYSGLLGALSAGALNTLHGAMTETQNTVVAHEIRRFGNGENFKNAVIDSFGDNSIAKQYAQGLKNNPTTFQLSRLLYEVNNNFESEIINDVESALVKQGFDKNTARNLARKYGASIADGGLDAVDWTNVDDKVRLAVLSAMPSIAAKFNVKTQINNFSNGIVPDTFASTEDIIDEDTVKTDAATIAPDIASQTSPEDTAFDIAVTIKDNNATVSDAFAESVKEKLVNKGVREGDAETIVNAFQNAANTDDPVSDITAEALANPDVTDAVNDTVNENMTESERIITDIKKAEAAANNETETSPVTKEETGKETKEERDAQGVDKLLKDLGLPAELKPAIQSRYEMLDGVEAKAYLAGLRNAYKYGQTIPQSAIKDDIFYDMLTDTEKDTFFKYGEAAAENKAKQGEAEITALQEKNNTGKQKVHKEGTVRGDGVSIDDLVKRFNDTQKTAYKILADLSRATGVNVVLYESKPDANGNFVGKQGRFKKSEDTIYIDINAGLKNIKSSYDLAKYVMVRTFSHEFVHFCQKWSPVLYLKFKKLVFSVIDQHGENANELIELKQKAGMNYVQASDEAVAEAMADVVPTVSFMTRLKNASKELFEKFVERFKEFDNNVREYYKRIGASRDRGAEAVREERDGALNYTEAVLNAYEEMAADAIYNYQLAVALDAEGEEVITTEEIAETGYETEPAEQLQDKKKSEIEEMLEYMPVYGQDKNGNMVKYTADDILEKAEKKPSGQSNKKAKAISESKLAEKRKKIAERILNRAEDNVAFSKASVDENGTQYITDKYIMLVMPANKRLDVPTRETGDPLNGSKMLADLLKRATNNSSDKFDVAALDSVRVLKEYAKSKKPYVIADSNVAVNAGLLAEVLELLPSATTIKSNNSDEPRRLLLSATDGEVQVAFTTMWVKDIAEAKKTTAEILKEIYEKFGIDKDTAKYVVKTEKKQTAEEAREKAEDNNGGENANNEGAVLRTDSDGQRDTRLPENSEAENVPRNGRVGDAARVSADDGGNGERRSDREHAGGNEHRSSERVSEGTVPVKPLPEVVDEEIDEMSLPEPRGTNFVWTDDFAPPTTFKTRVKANFEALELLATLEKENRYATAEEQKILAQFTGWGGLSAAFGEYDYRSRGFAAKTGYEIEFYKIQKLISDGILSKEQAESLRRSSDTAYYTPRDVVRGMYAGLQKMGFEGGRILEPSAGTGNFISNIPDTLLNKIKQCTMVEIDTSTGNILKYLFPNNDVRVEGFEKTNLPNNFMDLVIGNVPFGDLGISDRTYPSNITRRIHNYFIAKTIDKLRAGGVAMLITTSGTLDSTEDSVREYIANRADLIGAIRLPSTTFGDTGTNVVADILILQKREAQTAYAGEKFLEVVRAFNDGGMYSQNEYFSNHPEMILGTLKNLSYRYGTAHAVYSPLEGNLGDQIADRLSRLKIKLPEVANTNTTEIVRESVKMQDADGQTRFSVDKNGNVVQGNNAGRTFADAQAGKIKLYVPIRDTYKALLNAIMQGEDEPTKKALRKKLNESYDAFFKKYGALNKPQNRNLLLEDADGFSVLAIEKYNDKGEASKMDIFTKDTIGAVKTIEHVENVPEGVMVSMSVKGYVDVDYIAKLTGKTSKAVVNEIVESRRAFKDENGNFVIAETYLSGNVRAKLKVAEMLAKADPSYAPNVEALKQVQPKDLEYNQIDVVIGVTWVPLVVYEEFVAHLMDTKLRQLSSYYGSAQNVTITRDGDEYTLKINENMWTMKRLDEWGTNRRRFQDLMLSLLKGTTIEVRDEVENPETGKKKSVLNREETEAALDMANRITKEFKEWLWKDETRRNELTRLYNDTFNAWVDPEYSGEGLELPGKNPSFVPMEHQNRAIARMLYSGECTLIAHAAGAGKTFEISATAMKMRQLGIAKKPLIVVPKSLVAQWGKDFLEAFPAAKLFVADEKSFTKENRKINVGRMANGDYDAIIISYEQFERLPLSAEYIEATVAREKALFVQSKAEAIAVNGKEMTTRQYNSAMSSIEKRFEQLKNRAMDSDVLPFEKIGVDYLFVDEAHNYKNLLYTTKLKNVSGLGNPEGNIKTLDMLAKVQYLQKVNGGRGVCFATATPIMNSVSELYIMQKYMQPDVLKQLNIETFDAWCKEFGDVHTEFEVKPSGTGFRKKQSLTFRNVPELQTLYRSFADVVPKIHKDNIPKVRGGKPIIVNCPPSEEQLAAIAELDYRASNLGKIDKTDNMLAITTEGRKYAYTRKMIDAALTYEEEGKIVRCAKNIVKEYKASNDRKGTQIVFIDFSTPKRSSETKADTSEEAIDVTVSAGEVSLYSDLKEMLVEQGIPAKEIAFIHDAPTAAARSALFDAMNTGKVRVLIGSTGKMGVGMNAQKKCVALHHVDCPWRPGDLIQREARAIRQGNENSEVGIYVYVTEKSFDARLWDIIHRKNTVIQQMQEGNNVGRTMEDTGDVVLSAAEIKAVASNNPMLEKEVKLASEVDRLARLKTAHEERVANARRKIATSGGEIARYEKLQENIKKDIERRTDTYKEENFEIKLGDKVFHKKDDATAALTPLVIRNTKTSTPTKIGEFAGFDVKVYDFDGEAKGMLSGAASYPFNVSLLVPGVNINNMMRAAAGLEDALQTTANKLQTYRAEVETQQKIANTPFEYDDELNEKRKQHAEIMQMLTDNEATIATLSDDEQGQEREEPLTDREVLAIAASRVETSDYSEGQKEALRIFKEKLDALEAEENERAELGKQYKELQFGEHPNRDEATKTLNRMRVLDSSIARKHQDLLDTEAKDVLQKILQKARRVVMEEERAHQREILRRYKDRRDNSEAIQKYRKRIAKDVGDLYEWITKPDDKAAKRVPDVLKRAVGDFLYQIDATSKRSLNGGAPTKSDNAYRTSLEKLKCAIENNATVKGLTSGYSDLPENFMQTMESMIAAVENIVAENSEGFVLNKMTSKELKDLSLLVRTVKWYVREMNHLIENAKYQHVSEAGENTIDEMKSISSAKPTATGLQNFFLYEHMRPAYVWDRFGEGGRAIYDEIMDGQELFAFLALEIREFAEKTFTAKEVKAWHDKTETFNVGDKTITVPHTFIMSLYELMKQEDARRHIFGGGVRVAAFKNGAKRFSEDAVSGLTPELVADMIGTLSDREKEVADKLQNFMATKGAEWLNYVSLKRWGTSMIDNPSYFPINSDGRVLEASAGEHPSNASLYALLNASFTKERNEHADNRLILYDIFDVFSYHMASVAQYRAFALPILDTLKWLNYKSENGAVKDELTRVFGAPAESKPGSGATGYAVDFITNIIKAFNGTESQGDISDIQGINWLRRYNMAQIAFNVRVFVQQPASIIRAGAILKPASLAKGLKNAAKHFGKSKAEMYKYSGIAVWKTPLGYYDTNISRGLAADIKHDDTFMHRALEVGMTPAEKMDELAWVAMWEASKEEAISMGYSGEELLKQTAYIMRDVIAKTQVVDSVLTKTQFSRRKSFVAKALSSFMSEPVTTASMIVDVVEQYNRDIRKGMAAQEAFKKYGPRFARLAAIYALNSIVLAAVTALIDAARDDDDDPFGKKYGEHFVENLLDELSPFNKYPYIRDFAEMGQALLKAFKVDEKLGIEMYSYSPRSILGQGFDTFVKGISIIQDKIDGKKKGYTWYAGIQKLLQGASGFTGAPLGTITREVVNAWNVIIGSMNENLKIQTYVSADEVDHWLVKAIEANDTERIEKLKDKYFNDEDSFKSGIKSAIGNMFVDGEITEEQATEYYMYVQQMFEGESDANAAYWQIDKWKYRKEEGTSEGYVKYGEDFFRAIETGKNLKETITRYTDNGVKPETIAAQITEHYKPIYKNMSNAERARLKGYLLNAYALLGYSRSDKNRDINSWAK